MSALFIDVDTQLDFLYPAGALDVPGAEHVVPAIAQLNRYATAHGIPLLSTVDAHTEDDPEFKSWPKHCVAGTWGQHKPAATLVGGTQTIFEKQTLNAFEAPALVPTVQSFQPDRFVVYGVVTEVCVLYAVRGLMQFGKPVTLVVDAIKEFDAEAGAKALAEMRAAGVIISSTGSETSH